MKSGHGRRGTSMILSSLSGLIEHCGLHMRQILVDGIVTYEFTGEKDTKRLSSRVPAVKDGRSNCATARQDMHCDQVLYCSRIRDGVIIDYVGSAAIISIQVAV